MTPGQATLEGRVGVSLHACICLSARREVQEVCPVTASRAIPNYSLAPVGQGSTPLLGGPKPNDKLDNLAVKFKRHLEASSTSAFAKQAENQQTKNDTD